MFVTPITAFSFWAQWSLRNPTTDPLLWASPFTGGVCLEGSTRISPGADFVMSSCISNSGAECTKTEYRFRIVLSLNLALSSNIFLHGFRTDFSTDCLFFHKLISSSVVNEKYITKSSIFEAHSCLKSDSALNCCFYLWVYKATFFKNCCSLCTMSRNTTISHVRHLFSSRASNTYFQKNHWHFQLGTRAPLSQACSHICCHFLPNSLSCYSKHSVWIQTVCAKH